MPKTSLTQKEKENNEQLHEAYSDILGKFFNRFSGKGFLSSLKQAKFAQSENEKWEKLFNELNKSLFTRTIDNSEDFNNGLKICFLDWVNQKKTECQSYVNNLRKQIKDKNNPDQFEDFEERFAEKIKNFKEINNLKESIIEILNDKNEILQGWNKQYIQYQTDFLDNELERIKQESKDSGFVLDLIQDFSEIENKIDLLRAQGQVNSNFVIEVIDNEDRKATVLTYIDSGFVIEKLKKLDNKNKCIKSMEEVEKNLQDTEVYIKNLEAELQEKNQKINMLDKDLKDNGKNINILLTQVDSLKFEQTEKQDKQIEANAKWIKCLETHLTPDRKKEFYEGGDLDDALSFIEWKDELDDGTGYSSGYFEDTPECSLYSPNNQEDIDGDEEGINQLKVGTEEGQSQRISELIKLLTADLEAKNGDLRQLKHEKFNLETRVEEIDKLEAEFEQNGKALDSLRKELIEQKKQNEELSQKLDKENNLKKELKILYEEEVNKLGIEKDELSTQLNTQNKRLDQLKQNMETEQKSEHQIVIKFQAQEVRLEELSKKLEEKTNQLKKSEEEVVWLNELVKAKPVQIEKERAKLSGQLVDKNKALFELEQKLKANQKEAELKKNKLQAKTSQLKSQHQQEKSELENQLKAIKGEKECLTQEFKKLQEKIHKLEGQHKQEKSELNQTLKAKLKEKEGKLETDKSKLGDEISSLENQLGVNAKEIAKLTKDKNELERKLLTSKEEKNNIDQQLEAKSRELNQVQAEKGALKDQIEEQVNKITELNRNKDELKQALQTGEVEKEKIIQQLEAKSQELNQVQAESNKLKDKVSKLEIQFKVNQEEGAQFKKQLEAKEHLTQELTELQGKANRLEIGYLEKLTELENKKKELENRIQTNEGKSTQLQTKLSKELKDKERELARLKAENQNVVEKLNKNKSELKEKTNQLEAKKGKLFDQLEALKNKEAEFTNKLSGLMDEKNKLEMQLRGKQAELKEQEGKLEKDKRGWRNKISQLETENSELVNKVQTNEKVITELNDNTNKFKENINQLEIGRAALTQRLKAQDEKMNGAGDNKKVIEDAFSKKSEELKRQHQETVDDLTQQLRAIEEEKKNLGQQLTDLKAKPIKAQLVDQSTQYLDSDIDDPIEADSVSAQSGSGTSTSTQTITSDISASTQTTVGHDHLDGADPNPSLATPISSNAATTPIQAQSLNTESELSKNAVSLLLFQLEALSDVLKQVQAKKISVADAKRSDLLKHIQSLQQVAKSTSNQEGSAEEGSSDQGEEKSQGLISAQLAELYNDVKKAVGEPDEDEGSQEGETDESAKEEKKLQLQAQIQKWMKLLAQQIAESKTMLEDTLKPEAGNEQKKQALKLQKALSDHLDHLLPFPWLVQSWNDMENQVSTLGKQVNQLENRDTSLKSIDQKINDKNYLLFLRALSEHSGLKKELEPIVFHKEGLAEYISKLEGDRSNSDHSSSNLLLKEWIQINRNAIGFAMFFKDQAPYVDQSRSEKKIELGSDYQTVVKRAYEKGRCCLDLEANNENGILSLSADPKPFTDFARRPEPDFYTTHIFNMSQGGKFETVDGWVKNCSDQYTYTKTLTSLPNQILEKGNKYQEIEVNDPVQLDKIIKVKIPSSALIELAAKMLLDFASKVDVTERIHINHAEDPVLVEALWGAAKVLKLEDRLENNTKHPNRPSSHSNFFHIFGSSTQPKVNDEIFSLGIEKSIAQDSKLQKRVEAFCKQNEWYKQGVDKTLEQVLGLPAPPQQNDVLTNNPTRPKTLYGGGR